MTAAGETTWCGFARVIFSGWHDRGHRVPVFEPIASADYPSLEERPANSRLDCGKIDRVFGIRMPLWSASLEACLDVIAAAQKEERPC